MKRGTSTGIQLSFLGEAEARGPRHPIPLSPQQTALLTVVYGHGERGVTRPKVLRLLWGSEAGSTGRHRLRQLLVELRHRLGHDIVVSDGDVLRGNPLFTSDLQAFEHELERGSLHKVAGLARMGFGRIPGARFTGEYEDWRSAVELSQFRQVRVQALTTWERAQSSGDVVTARDAAEALYALDSLDPRSVLRMIETMGRQGQIVGAERVFAEFAEGCGARSPSEAEIVAVRDAIQRARRLKDVGAPEAYGDGTPLPLVGRKEAVASVIRVLDRVGSGQYGLVVVTGESGIGKTRMLQEVHREAVMRGFRCLGAKSVEVESRVPLNPLLDALRSVTTEPLLRSLGKPWDAVVASLLPIGMVNEPGPALPPIDDRALPRRLLDAFALLFEHLANEQPTLLLLDDLHWADATTIAVLQFLHGRWRNGPLGVVATLRTDLAHSSDAVSGYLTTLKHRPDVTWVELTELSSTEAQQLVGEIGQGRIPEEIKLRICALTGRHPMYLTEFTRDYLGGRIQLPEVPGEEVGVPVSLQSILDQRLRYLSDPAIRLAGLLAVAARAIRLSDLTEMARLSIDDGADAIDELCRMRLVVTEKSHVRIAHDLVRSAIYSQLSDARRSVNHLRVGEYILLEEGPESAAGELAIHFSRAGDAAAASNFGWMAAEHAMRAGAVAEAAHFYELVGVHCRDATRAAEAVAGQARALYLDRNINRATPLLELATARLAAVGRRRDALRLEIRRLEGLAAVGGGTLTRLLERLGQVKQEAGAEGDWEGVALALDAELHLRHRSGDLTTLPQLFAEMRRIAEKDCPKAKVLCNAGLALGVLFGDPEEAMRAAEAAVALTRVDASYRLQALLRLMVVLQYRGRLELPVWGPIIHEARELAKGSGDRLVHFSIESNLACAALDAGDLDRAQVQLARSSRLTGAGEMDLNRFIQANNWAELALARGEFEEASAAFSQAASYAGPTTPGYMIDLVNAGIGLCALESGNFSGARLRERELHPTPSRWYFDPTTIVTFRARLQQRGGDAAAAVELVRAASVDVEDRLVLAWLKLEALHARLLSKVEPSRAHQVALHARERAEELNLTYRVRELSLLASGLARR